MSLVGYSNRPLLLTMIVTVQGNDVVFFQPASEYLPMMDKVCDYLDT